MSTIDSPSSIGAPPAQCVPVIRGHPVALEPEVRLLPAAGLPHEQLEGGVGRLELVALGLEVLEPVGQLGRGPVVEVDAELAGLQRHPGPATQVGHQHPRVVAHNRGVDVLVAGPADLAERGRVQPALVGERRRTDVGVGGVGRQVHQLGHVPADRGEPLDAPLGQTGDAHLELQVGHHRHEVGVARALAVAVDRPLDVGDAGDDGGHRVGHGAAAVVLRVDAELLIGAEVGRDLGHDPLDLVGQRATVGVAQHEDLGALDGRRLEHPERELGVGLVAVEEVLGVEEHPLAGRPQEPHGVGHHGDALVERGAQRLGHVEGRALADDARRRHARLDQGGQRRVDVHLAERTPGRAEGDERRRVERQLAGRRGGRTRRRGGWPAGSRPRSSARPASRAARRPAACPRRSARCPRTAPRPGGWCRRCRRSSVRRAPTPSRPACHPTCSTQSL